MLFGLRLFLMFQFANVTMVTVAVVPMVTVV